MLEVAIAFDVMLAGKHCRFSYSLTLQESENESLDEIELTLHNELKILSIHMPFLERMGKAQADRWSHRAGKDYIWKGLTMRGVSELLSSLVVRDSATVCRRGPSPPTSTAKHENLMLAL